VRSAAPDIGTGTHNRDQAGGPGSSGWASARSGETVTANCRPRRLRRLPAGGPRSAARSTTFPALVQAFRNLVEKRDSGAVEKLTGTSARSCGCGPRPASNACTSFIGITPIMFCAERARLCRQVLVGSRNNIVDANRLRQVTAVTTITLVSKSQSEPAEKGSFKLSQSPSRLCGTRLMERLRHSPRKSSSWPVSKSREQAR